MRIKIAEKIRPYTLEKKTLFPVPLSPYCVRIFSDRLLFSHQITGETFEKSLPFHGFLRQFVAQADLEKGMLRIFGMSENGQARYNVFHRDSALYIEFPKEKRCEEISVAEAALVPPNLERLSLGSHKKQDMRLIMRRQDLKEILPIWYHVAQLQPHSEREFPDVEKSDFLQLFEEELEGIFCAKDPALYGAIHKRIRSLFIQNSDGKIAILPKLPTKLHCGRFLHVAASPDLQLDMEWSKKQIRRLVLYPKTDCQIDFLWQKDLRSFRMRMHSREKGTRFQTTQKLTLKKGQTYFLDRFMK